MLTFLYIPGTFKETAILFDNIASIGWISLASFFLWFSLIFTKKKRILKIKIIYPLIFALPSLFVYHQWTGLITADYIEKSWGWAGIWSGSIWTYLFFTYFITFIVIGIYLIYDFKMRTKNLYEQKQAKVIFNTAIIALIFSIIIEVILPELQIIKLPSLGNVITLIWAGGLAYAMVKYKLMTITPGIVALKILSTMADSVVLLDREGKIVTLNKSLEGLTGYKEDELKGETIDLFFPEQNLCHYLLDKPNNKSSIRNLELDLKTKNKDNVPVIISGSLLSDETGMIAGIVYIIKDISEIKEAEKKLREEKRFFNILMDYIPDSIYFKDKGLRFIRVNRTKAGHSGMPPEEMIGLDDFDVFPVNIARQCFLDDTGVIKSSRPIIGKIEKIVHSNKEEYWASVTKVPWYDDNGEVKGLVGISRDITKHREMADKLRNLSRRDSLTGCYNRRYGLEVIQRHIRLSNRNQSPLLLAFLDIDNFKQINDKYGHSEGDTVLKRVVNSFKEQLREVDIICRVGGDEFLLAFPGSSLKDVYSIKERLSEALAALNNEIKTKKNCDVQLSMGFSEYLPEKPENLDDLIAVADQQMYKEKNSRKRDRIRTKSL